MHLLGDLIWTSGLSSFICHLDLNSYLLIPGLSPWTWDLYFQFVHVHFQFVHFQFVTYPYLLVPLWVSIRYLNHSMPKIASLTSSLILLCSSHSNKWPCILPKCLGKIHCGHPWLFFLSFIFYIHKHILSYLYSKYIQNLTVFSATFAIALVYALILFSICYFLSLLTGLPGFTFSPTEFIFQVATTAVLLKRTKAMPLLCIKHYTNVFV